MASSLVIELRSFLFTRLPLRQSWGWVDVIAPVNEEKTQVEEDEDVAAERVRMEKSGDKDLLISWIKVVLVLKGSSSIPSLPLL